MSTCGKKRFFEAWQGKKNLQEAESQSAGSLTTTGAWARAILPALTWLFLGELLLSSAPLRFTRQFQNKQSHQRRGVKHQNNQLMLGIASVSVRGNSRGQA